MIVAMFVKTKNPTMQTFLKVALSTVQHRILGIVWSCFSLFHYTFFAFKEFFGLYGVAASSLARLYDLVLVRAISPVCGKKRRNSSFHFLFFGKFFHVGLRVCMRI